MPAKAPQHRCPGRDCKQVIHTRQLACLTCWLSLSQEVRDFYAEVYSNRREDPVAYKATRAAILAQLRHPEPERSVP